MQFGVDSFAAMVEQPGSNVLPEGADRLATLLQEVEVAEQAGIDVFGIGEHHRAEFLDSAPAIILAAAAARTSRIRLTSAVTVLSAADPVRVFQDFSTLDLISRGRAELVVGRGSFGEAFPLFGYAREDYDALFAEKLELLLKLNVETHPRWSGRYRPTLQGQGVYPRPHQPRLPIWLGVGGTPQSFVRAGLLGLPLMIGIIGGSFDQFVPAVRLYREAGARAGHDLATLSVAVHAMGFVGDSDAAAREAFFPGWAHMFGQAARERGWSQPTRAQFDALCSPQGSFLIGDPATVAAKIVAVDACLGGLARITFQMSTAMWEPDAMLRSIELVGGEVRERVQSLLQDGQARQ